LIAKEPRLSPTKPPESEEAALPRLLIVIASTRPGRAGLPIGEWVRDQALSHAGFAVDVADLAEINLPLLDEPNHPRLHQYTREHTRAWSVQVAAADAIILVMPEYNHGYTAPLKNAIDYLYREWQYKPVGLVSYGGVVGGTRAVQQLKPVLAALKLVPMVEAVPIVQYQQYMSEEERFTGSEALETAMTTMLNELLRWAAALRLLRNQPVG
jgi:NAD(P)H-dependent FMN reductase